MQFFKQVAVNLRLTKYAFIRTLTAKQNLKAVCETSAGTFVLELFSKMLPITVGSFIDLSRKGFYDGLHFHRVIKDFMIQFGCPYSKDPFSHMVGTGGPTPFSTFQSCDGSSCVRDSYGNIIDEWIHKISNTPGTVSMANTGKKNTSGSQFFINVADNTFLDYWRPTPSGHPVFGEVISGMDVINNISRVKTNINDAPVTPVKMLRVTIE
ncbi:uncharacterized protein LOC135122424 [Zophobas morio]|uniref:uncharacterized protein LOC135122424 n=1 Tax=Zophobas morio TaxID=2755281 RepID=UPI0030833703